MGQGMADMKTVILLLAAVLLTACAPTVDATECQKSWAYMEAPAGQEEWAIDVILHYDWPKASHGEYVSNCLRSGWEPDTPQEALGPTG